MKTSKIRILPSFHIDDVDLEIKGQQHQQIITEFLKGISRHQELVNGLYLKIPDDPKNKNLHLALSLINDSYMDQLEEHVIETHHKEPQLQQLAIAFFIAKRRFEISKLDEEINKYQNENKLEEQKVDEQLHHAEFIFGLLALIEKTRIPKEQRNEKKDLELLERFIKEFGKPLKKESDFRDAEREFLKIYQNVLGNFGIKCQSIDDMSNAFHKAKESQRKQIKQQLLKKLEDLHENQELLERLMEIKEQFFKKAYAQYCENKNKENKQIKLFFSRKLLTRIKILKKYKIFICYDGDLSALQKELKTVIDEADHLKEVQKDFLLLDRSVFYKKYYLENKKSSEKEINCFLKALHLLRKNHEKVIGQYQRERVEDVATSQLQCRQVLAAYIKNYELADQQSKICCATRLKLYCDLFQEYYPMPVSEVSIPSLTAEYSRTLYWGVETYEEENLAYSTLLDWARAQTGYPYLSHKESRFQFKRINHNDLQFEEKMSQQTQMIQYHQLERQLKIIFLNRIEYKKHAHENLLIATSFRKYTATKLSHSTKLFKFKNKDEKIQEAIFITRLKRYEEKYGCMPLCVQQAPMQSRKEILTRYDEQKSQSPFTISDPAISVVEEMEEWLDQQQGDVCVKFGKYAILTPARLAIVAVRIQYFLQYINQFIQNHQNDIQLKSLVIKVITYREVLEEEASNIAKAMLHHLEIVDLQGYADPMQTISAKYQHFVDLQSEQKGDQSIRLSIQEPREDAYCLHLSLTSQERSLEDFLNTNGVLIAVQPFQIFIQHIEKYFCGESYINVMIKIFTEGPVKIKYLFEGQCFVPEAFMLPTTLSQIQKENLKKEFSPLVLKLCMCARNVKALHETIKKQKYRCINLSREPLKAMIESAENLLAIEDEFNQYFSTHAALIAANHDMISRIFNEYKDINTNTVNKIESILMVEINSSSVELSVFQRLCIALEKMGINDIKQRIDRHVAKMFCRQVLSLTHGFYQPIHIKTLEASYNTTRIFDDFCNKCLNFLFSPEQKAAIQFFIDIIKRDLSGSDKKEINQIFAKDKNNSFKKFQEWLEGRLLSQDISVSSQNIYRNIALHAEVLCQNQKNAVTWFKHLMELMSHRSMDIMHPLIKTITRASIMRAQHKKITEIAKQLHELFHRSEPIEDESQYVALIHCLVVAGSELAQIKLNELYKIAYNTSDRTYYAQVIFKLKECCEDGIISVDKDQKVNRLPSIIQSYAESRLVTLLSGCTSNQPYNCAPDLALFTQAVNESQAFINYLQTKLDHFFKGHPKILQSHLLLNAIYDWANAEQQYKIIYFYIKGIIKNSREQVPDNVASQIIVGIDKKLNERVRNLLSQISALVSRKFRESEKYGHEYRIYYLLALYYSSIEERVSLLTFYLNDLPNLEQEGVNEVASVINYKVSDHDLPMFLTSFQNTWLATNLKHSDRVEIIYPIAKLFGNVKQRADAIVATIHQKINSFQVWYQHLRAALFIASNSSQDPQIPGKAKLKPEENIELTETVWRNLAEAINESLSDKAVDFYYEMGFQFEVEASFHGYATVEKIKRAAKNNNNDLKEIFTQAFSLYASNTENNPKFLAPLMAWADQHQLPSTDCRILDLIAYIRQQQMPLTTTYKTKFSKETAIDISVDLSKLVQSGDLSRTKRYLSSFGEQSFNADLIFIASTDEKKSQDHQLKRYWNPAAEYLMKKLIKKEGLKKEFNEILRKHFNGWLVDILKNPSLFNQYNMGCDSVKKLQQQNLKVLWGIIRKLKHGCSFWDLEQEFGAQQCPELYAGLEQFFINRNFMVGDPYPAAELMLLAQVARQAIEFNYSEETSALQKYKQYDFERYDLFASQGELKQPAEVAIFQSLEHAILCDGEMARAIERLQSLPQEIIFGRYFDLLKKVRAQCNAQTRAQLEFEALILSGKIEKDQIDTTSENMVSPSVIEYYQQRLEQIRKILHSNNFLSPEEQAELKQLEQHFHLEGYYDLIIKKKNLAATGLNPQELHQEKQHQQTYRKLYRQYFYVTQDSKRYLILLRKERNQFTPEEEQTSERLAKELGVSTKEYQHYFYLLRKAKSKLSSEEKRTLASLEEKLILFVDQNESQEEKEQLSDGNERQTLVRGERNLKNIGEEIQKTKFSSPRTSRIAAIFSIITPSSSPNNKWAIRKKEIQDEKKQQLIRLQSKKAYSLTADEKLELSFYREQLGLKDVALYLPQESIQAAQLVATQFEGMVVKALNIIDDEEKHLDQKYEKERIRANLKKVIQKDGLLSQMPIDVRKKKQLLSLIRDAAIPLGGLYSLVLDKLNSGRCVTLTEVRQLILRATPEQRNQLQKKLFLIIYENILKRCGSTSNLIELITEHHLLRLPEEESHNALTPEQFSRWINNDLTLQEQTITLLSKEERALGEEAQQQLIEQRSITIDEQEKFLKMIFPVVFEGAEKNDLHLLALRDFFELLRPMPPGYSQLYGDFEEKFSRIEMSYWINKVNNTIAEVARENFKNLELLVTKKILEKIKLLTSEFTTHSTQTLQMACGRLATQLTATRNGCIEGQNFIKYFGTADEQAQALSVIQGKDWQEIVQLIQSKQYTNAKTSLDSKIKITPFDLPKKSICVCLFKTLKNNVDTTTSIYEARALLNSELLKTLIAIDTQAPIDILSKLIRRLISSHHYHLAKNALINMQQLGDPHSAIAKIFIVVLRTIHQDEKNGMKNRGALISSGFLHVFFHINPYMIDGLMTQYEKIGDMSFLKESFAKYLAAHHIDRATLQMKDQNCEIEFKSDHEASSSRSSPLPLGKNRYWLKAQSSHESNSSLLPQVRCQSAFRNFG